MEDKAVPWSHLHVVYILSVRDMGHTMSHFYLELVLYLWTEIVKLSSGPLNIGFKITVTYLPHKVLKENSISLRQISIHVCRRLSGKKEASVRLRYISSITVKSEGLVTPHLDFSRGKLLHCLEVTLWKENLLRTWLEALTERREEVASALLPPGSSGSPKPKLPPLQSSWEWCLELSLSSKWFWFISNSRNTGLVFPRVFLLRLQLGHKLKTFPWVQTLAK